MNSALAAKKLVEEKAAAALKKAEEGINIYRFHMFTVFSTLVYIPPNIFVSWSAAAEKHAAAEKLVAEKAAEKLAAEQKKRAEEEKKRAEEEARSRK